MTDSAIPRKPRGTCRTRRRTALLAAVSAFALPVPALSADGDVDLSWEAAFGAWHASCVEADAASAAFCSVGTLDGSQAGMWVLYYLRPDEAPDLGVRVVVNSIFVASSGPLVFRADDGSEIGFDEGYMVLNNSAAELIDAGDITAVVDLLGSGIGAMTVSVPLSMNGPMIGAFDVTGFADAYAALREHVAGWTAE